MRGDAGAGNPGAHLVEAVGDVADLRLARRVLDHRGAAGERRRHQRGVGAADGDLGEDDLAAAQAFFGARDHIAAFDLDVGAELCQRHDQEIDRARADGAAARHRDFRLAHARHQRRQHPEACAHARDQLVGRGGVDDRLGRDVQRAAAVGILARAFAGDHDVDAVIAEDALQLADIGEMRHVVEDERILGQQAGDHQRQRGVLGARNRDDAGKRLAADNANTIHDAPLAAACGRTLSLGY